MEFFKAWMTRSNPAEPLEQAVRKWKALWKGFWCARLQHLLLKPLQSQASCTSFLICKLLTSESTGSCMAGPQTAQRTGMRLRTLTRAQFPALLQTNGQNSLSKIQKAEEGVNTACISHFSCRLFCAKTKHCGWGLGLLTSGPWRAHLVFRHLGWLVWVSTSSPQQGTPRTASGIQGHAWPPSSPPSPNSLWKPTVGATAPLHPSGAPAGPVGTSAPRGSVLQFRLCVIGTGLLGA